MINTNSLIWFKVIKLRWIKKNLRFRRGPIVGLIGGATVVGIITKGEFGLRVSPMISISSSSSVVCVVAWGVISTSITTFVGAELTREEVLAETSTAAWVSLAISWAVLELGPTSIIVGAKGVASTEVSATTWPSLGSSILMTSTMLLLCLMKWGLSRENCSSKSSTSIATPVPSSSWILGASGAAPEVDSWWLFFLSFHP